MRYQEDFEDILMHAFDKKWSSDRRQLFLRRMEHKLHAKEQRLQLYTSR